MSRRRASARGWWTRAGGATALLLAAAVACGRGDNARAAPARHEVVIRGFAFAPPSLAIAAGDTVVWSNQDIVPHTATAEDGRWNSDTLAAGASWRRVFAEAGAHPYRCRLHPVMKASVDVQ